jgi:hypothetical protein
MYAFIWGEKSAPKDSVSGVIGPEGGELHPPSGVAPPDRDAKSGGGVFVSLLGEARIFAHLKPHRIEHSEKGSEREA